MKMRLWYKTELKREGVDYIVATDIKDGYVYFNYKGRRRRVPESLIGEKLFADNEVYKLANVKESFNYDTPTYAEQKGDFPEMGDANFFSQHKYWKH